MESLFGRLGGGLVAHRFVVLAVAAVITSVAGYYMSKVGINTANEYFFLPNDEFLTRYDDYKKTFGSDEFVYVLFTADEVFEPEVLNALKRFEARVLADVPYVSEVTSIVDAEHITSEDDSILVEPFMGDAVPTDASALAAFKEQALANPLFTSIYVSPDSRFAGVLIENEIRENDGEYRKTIYDAVRKVADRPEFAVYKPKVVGPAVMDADVDRTLASESRKFGLMSFVIIMLVLAWTFRRFVDVFAPMLVIGVTNVWVLGLMGAFDIPLTMMSIVLPGVVLVVGCGDAIHVIAEYRLQVVKLDDVNAAIRETVRLTGLPCLFTSLTTMVGFGSLMAMDLRPGREMGMFAAIGVLVAFVNTYTLLPPLLSFSSTTRIASSNDNLVWRAFRWVLGGCADLAVNRRGTVALVGAALFAGGLWGLTKVQVSADFLRVFDESTRIRKDYDYVDKHLGGTGTVEFILDAGKPSGVFDPAFLADVDALDNWLSTHPMVKSTISLLDVLRELNKVAHDGDPAFYVAPDSRQMAAQLFLLYEMGGAEEIERLITPERDRAHLTARTRSVSSQDFEKFMGELDTWSAANFKHGKVETTGMVPLFVRMVHFLTRSQIASFSIAFVLVSLMMIALFRSFGLGLLSMVPNIIPIAITFGFMGFRGITLNVATVMIASIAIGIAVDDSIHFVSHFRHYRDQGLSTEAAVRKTINGVGQALLTTSVVLALGFSVFGLSDIAHLTNFGLLTALTVVTALAADFLLLPALLLLVDRKSLV